MTGLLASSLHPEGPALELELGLDASKPYPEYDLATTGLKIEVELDAKAVRRVLDIVDMSLSSCNA
jgi:hypothetical protein